MGHLQLVDLELKMIFKLTICTKCQQNIHWFNVEIYCHVSSCIYISFFNKECFIVWYVFTTNIGHHYTFQYD